jgi:hypothetical protein
MRNRMRLTLGLSLAGCVAILVGTRLQASRTELRSAKSEVVGVTAGSSQISVEAFLAKRVGKYVTVTKLFLSPSEPPFVGTARISSILEGRFLREDTFTKAHGKHSEVHLFGYDHLRKESQAVWMDSTSLRMQMMTGTGSDDGKTVTYSGWVGVGDADGQLSLRITTRQVDEDHFTVTATGVGRDGNEVPIEETTYTRKK